MNPAGFSEQMRRAWAIAKKDIRIYYFKGPVLIFGVFMPVFLFLAFFMGSRQLPLSFLISGLVGMTLFFTATAVSPAIFPWEGQAKTLERLASCPVTIEAIVFGDMIASILFGIGITFVTVIIGLALGLSLLHGILLLAAIFIAACLLLCNRDAACRATHECALEHHDALLADQVPAGLHLRYLHPAGADAAMGTGTCCLFSTDVFYRYCSIRVYRYALFPGSDRYRSSCGVHAGIYRCDHVPAQEDHATENVIVEDY